MRLDYTNLKRVKVPFQPKIEMGPVYLFILSRQRRDGLARNAYGGITA
jgi:hypothetical protein